MKSYLLNDCNPESVDLSSCLKPVVADEEAVEAELTRAALAHTRWEPCQTAAGGDMAVCRLASSLSRYNKERVRFIAGSGLFQKDLEQAVIGMQPGSRRTVSLPDGDVALELLEVSRRVVPPVDDTIVRALGIDGISTVSDYRSLLRRRQREETAQDLSLEPENVLIRSVIDGSAFVLYREDWLAMVTQRLNRVRALFRQEGKILEQTAPEDFAGRIPVNSYHELVAMEQREAWDDLCLYLLGRRYAEQDGFVPTLAGYEAYIASYQKTWRTTEHEACEIDPFPAWEINEYIAHAVARFRKIVLDGLLADTSDQERRTHDSSR